MDVTCPKCSTEYEFDDTLVSERGTTVKCTNCGHLFRIFRTEGAGDGKAWTLKRPDGGTEVFDSLATLQKWIGEGRANRDDLISRSGQGWKRLGDIAELATFFTAAEMSPTPARGARSPSGPAQQRTPSNRPPASEPGHQRASTIKVAVAPPPAPPPSPAAHATPHLQPASGKTLRPAAAPPPPAPPPRTPTPAPPAPSATSSTPPVLMAPGGNGQPADSRGTFRTGPMTAVDERGPTVGGDLLDLDPRPSGGWSSGSPSSRASREATDSQRVPGGRRSSYPLMIPADEEPSRAAPQRSSTPYVVIAVTAVLAAAAVVLWPRIAPLVSGAEEDPVAPHLARANEALARDTIDSLEDADRLFTKAQALRERDARVLAGLAQTHAAWAQALRDEADDMAARATVAGAEAATWNARAEAKRDEMRRRADRALRFAEDAVRTDERSADAEAALADSLRLKGDLLGARQHADRAMGLRERSAAVLYAHAMVTLDEAPARVDAATDLLRRAVAAEPRLNRARLQLARALVRQGQAPAATEVLRAVLAEIPDHPRARALSDAITQGLPLAVAAISDAGAVAASTASNDAGASAPSPPVTPAIPPTPAAGGAAVASGRDAGRSGASGAPDEVRPGRSYDSYVEQAERARGRGDLTTARRAYEAAIAVRPGGSEAIAGLGFVLLSMGQTGAAVERFREALRINPSFANAHFGLGDAYRRQGNRSEAVRSYRRYLDVNPNGSRASAAQHHIDVLSGSPDPSAQPDVPPTDRPPSDTPPGDTPGVAPRTGPGELPPPRGMTTPPPEDVPATESEPPGLGPP